MNIWPCSSVVEQYPEKVCVVCAIQTKATSNNNSGHEIGLTGISEKYELFFRDNYENRPF